MAAPNPVIFKLSSFFNQSRWLQIMDKNKVGFQIDLGEILIQGILINLIIPGLYFLTIPVEGVVKFLGRGVEGFAPPDKLPARLDSHLVEEWNQTIEDFGHAAAHGRRVDMKKGLPLKALGQKP